MSASITAFALLLGLTSLPSQAQTNRQKSQDTAKPARSSEKGISERLAGLKLQT